MKFTLPDLLHPESGRLSPGYLSYPFYVRNVITLCHEKKFIWYRVAKVGTRTIYDLFDRAELRLHDQQVRFHSNPAKRYPDYFKFAFVRNPWDRLVSCWKDKVVSYNYFRFSDDVRSKMKRFDYFVAYLGDVDIDRCDPHLRTQSKLVDVSNLDFTGRFESFAADLQQVIKALELGERRIQKLNASGNRKSYRHYYNEVLKQDVARLYHEDIETFSYEF